MPAPPPADSPGAVPPWLQALPRPIALVGYGVEGRETLAYLRKHGVGTAPGAVAVFDRALEPGRHPELAAAAGFADEAAWPGAITAYRTVVRSPGVRPDHPALRAAQDAGAHVTSATALFLAAAPATVVGVTGTLGKGTAVSLIATALAAAGRTCQVGGNIGVNPLAFLDTLTPATVAVLELSSFQLMGLTGRKPEVAVVLRTTSEHLDWHRDLAEYRRAKQGLLAPAEAPQQVICCADSEGALAVAAPRLARAWRFSRLQPVPVGIGTAAGRIYRYHGDGRPPERLEELEALRLPAPFSVENAAAACLAAEAVGAVGPAVRAALRDFPGLPHRLELVADRAGVRYFNDSYATRPDATLGALEAFTTQPLAVIAGGSEKHADFAALAAGLCAHPALRRLVLIGTTAPRLAAAVEAAAGRARRPAPPIARAESLQAAVAAARDALPDGGVVLFSPACASFDMFPNYKVRGERFSALARRGGP